MVLYADVLFLINALIDYLLLLLSARAAGEPLRRVRFGLGAVLGGLYAVLIFVPGFAFLNSGLYRAASAILMLLIAYGCSRSLVKQGIIFMAMVCALGGGVMAIGMMDRTALSLGRGVVYSIPDMKMVLLSGAACYAILSFAVPKLYRHTASGGELRPICFELMGASMELTALIDTGNTLTDPLNGQSVPVAEGESLRLLFPNENRPTREELQDPVPALERLNTGIWSGRFRLLPYRAVGVERGFLLAVKMDTVTLGGTTRRGVLVALSPTPVSDGGGYRVLTGGWER